MTRVPMFAIISVLVGMCGLAVDGAKLANEADAQHCQTQVMTVETEPTAEELAETAKRFDDALLVTKPVRDAIVDPFTHVFAASAPVSTICPFFAPKPEFYRVFAASCGVQGKSRAALDLHINRVWDLLQHAHSQAPNEHDIKNKAKKPLRVLKVFFAPLWTFRRYSDRSESRGGDEYNEALSADDLAHIIKSLTEKFTEDTVTGATDWTDWLVLPGSIYWGRLQEKHMVDTLPVFFSGKLVHVHNVLRQDYGTGGKFRAAVEKEAGDAVEQWVTKPEVDLVINGLSIGINVGEATGKHVDIQFQFEESPTAQFDPTRVFLNKGGVGFFANGASGPADGFRLIINRHRRIGNPEMRCLEGSLTNSWKPAAEYWSCALGDVGEYCRMCSGQTDMGPLTEAKTFVQTVFKTMSKSEKHRSYNEVGLLVAESFCATQAGNWQLLKVWPVNKIS